MRKTQMNLQKSGCASETIWTTWDSINWDKVARAVKSLQARIVKAVKAKHFHKAKALLLLLTRSFYGKLLAILRVTTNKGSRTCGVDKILWNTPQRKWKAIEQLSIKGYKAKPLKRKSIPKKNGKLRHLGIPTIRDRAIQALFKLGLEPIAETTADPNSYGFRPKRSCADAIVQCHNVLCQRKSAEWILEADIKGCFDNISHQWILQHIPLNKKHSEEKTKITHVQKGFDFLGFNVRKYKQKCLTKPNKDSVKSIFTSINKCVTDHKAVSQKELIRMITPKIRGWANFFRHSAAKQTFSLMDNKVFKLLWKWAKRRHPNKCDHWVKAKYFKTKGNRHWVFSATDKKQTCELPLFDATKIIRHTKIKNLSNPYDKEWEGYFRERTKRRLKKHQNISKLANAI